MIFIPLVILLILYFMYCLLMRYESRTLWSGVGFFGLLLMTILTAFFYAFYYSETLTKYPLTMDIGALLVAAAVLVILFFPLATIIMFFVEGTFGDFKENMGYDRLYRRGHDNVQMEIYLVAMGHNIRKYQKLKKRIKETEEKQMKQVQEMLRLFIC